MSPRSLLFPIALALLTSGCTRAELEGLGFSTYIVRLDKGEQEVGVAVSDLAGELGFEPLHIYSKATQGFAVFIPDELAGEIREHEDVKWVRKDEPINRVPPEEETPPGDEILPDPGSILGPTELPESIVRIGGAYLGAIDYSKTHVAVIDTGIDSKHPDLNVVDEYDAVGEAGGKKANGTDPNGHGTHVSGTIGGCADGEGVAGVAPCVPLHAVRVLDANGSGYISDIVAGMEYVLNHPEITVVNMSLGGPRWDGDDPMFEAMQALEKAGVLVVVAAGNESQDTENVSPAGYDLGLTVSAYDASGGSDNGYAWFSNYGDEVDIAAPGVSILSTWPGGQYAELDGTSMASPAVAGAVAVYRALHPNETPKQVANAVRNTAEAGLKKPGGHPEGMIDTEKLWK